MSEEKKANSNRSPGVLSDEKIEQMVTNTNLTENEREQYGRILRRFEYAKEQRETPTRFFDGMNYVEDYITNENNANTYLTPRANRTEVMLNTGTSEKKIDAIKNELLTMDFKARAESYDEHDRLLSDLGDDLTDISYRTFEQERDPLHDDTNMEIINTLLSQRGVYVQETLSTRTFRRGVQTLEQCQKRVISGLKVYPGNVALSPFRWNMQPFIVIYDRFDFDTAKVLFSHLPNFDRVMPQGAPLQSEYLGEQYDYRFGSLSSGEVEVMTYESLPDDEYQIIINGVPMLPPNTKLPWSYEGYDVQLFVNKAISTEWTFGRPVTAMAKSLQAFSNEYLRMLVRKAQQSIEPPLTVQKSGRVYDRNIWDPSAITQGIKKDDFAKLIDHDGPSQSDYQMYNLIEQKIEEFVGAPNIAQGMSAGRDMSATEVLTVTKQFLKSLGYLIYARMRIEQVLLEMRVHNVLDNYLDPVKRSVSDDNKPFDIYRSFEIDNAVLENKQMGKKIIYFVGEDPPDKTANKIFEFEERQAKIGNSIRVHYLNVKKIKKAAKHWKFIPYVQDKEGTALDKVLFQDQFNQAVQIAQVEASPLVETLNVDVIKESYQRKWKARDWFHRRIVPKELTEQGQPDEEVKAKAQQTLQELEGFKNSGSLGDQTIQGLQGAARGAQKAVEML